MRFRVERDVVVEAVAWTARALPARPVTPVLAGMLLDVGGGLTVSGFDYEVSRRRRSTSRSPRRVGRWFRDRLTIKASTDDAARATEQLDAELDGEDILVAFNPQYLLDGLAGVETDTRCASPPPRNPPSSPASRQPSPATLTTATS